MAGGWCLGGAEEWSSRGNGQEERASASVPAQRDYAETNIFSWIYSLLIAAEGQICKESVVIEGGRHQQHQQPSACTPTHAGATLLQRYVTYHCIEADAFNNPIEHKQK